MKRTLPITDYYTLEAPTAESLRVPAEILTTEDGRPLTTEAGDEIATEVGYLPWVPSLAELKIHLRLEVDDDREDDRLKQLLNAAADVVLREVSQDAKPTEYVGEAQTEPGQEYHFLRISKSNVTAVGEITEIDEEGTEYVVDEMDVQVRYRNGIVVIAREEGQEVFGGEGCWDIKVEFTSGLSAESREVAIFKQVVLETLHSLYNAPGRISDKQFRRTPAFNAAMRLLRDRCNMVDYTP